MKGYEFKPTPLKNETEQMISIVSRNALNLNFIKLQYEDFTSCFFYFDFIYVWRARWSLSEC